MRGERKRAAAAAHYQEILGELWDILPTARREASLKLIPKRFRADIDVHVTPSYAAWLAKRRGDDASDVRFRNSLVSGTEGKMAVQSLLRQCVDLVETLLEKGVDPDAALRLLPYEIYLAVTATYRERFDAPPLPELPDPNLIPFGP